MRLFERPMQPRLSTKIIVPYLLLALVIALGFLVVDTAVAALAAQLRGGMPLPTMLRMWLRYRFVIAGSALVLVGSVMYLGLIVARRVTASLQDLVQAAVAVTNGDLRRRPAIHSADELGVVAESFNRMIERLLDLYETSRTLSANAQPEIILSQATAAVQRIVAGATTAALLSDHDGWRYYIGHDSLPSLNQLQHRSMTNSSIALMLATRGNRPVIHQFDTILWQQLDLPDSFQQVCIAPLIVQGRLIGLLLILHPQPATFSDLLLEPFAAITTMVATALNNARLYLEVQHEGQRRQTILESIADGVVVCDATRQVVLMNPAAEALLDVYDWAKHRYHWDHLPLTPLHQAGQLGIDQQHQSRYEAHGRILSASRARWSSSAVTQAGEVIVLHNISDEAALDQAKTDLIAMMSHELRTPLTGMLGAVDLLARGFDGELSPMQLELVEAAQRQGRAMSAMIEKAMMIANLEMDRLPLTIQPTSVRHVIEAAIAQFSAHAHVNGVTVEIDLAADLPALLADAMMLDAALHQVLDNAITYGAGAPVRVEAQQAGSNIEIRIVDRGPGIPAEQLPHLFSRLHRSADSSSTAPRGIGLGLVITRELLARQGGTISVQSEPGCGSTFTLALPVATDYPQLVAG